MTSSLLCPLAIASSILFPLKIIAKQVPGTPFPGTASQIIDRGCTESAPQSTPIPAINLTHNQHIDVECSQGSLATFSGYWNEFPFNHYIFTIYNADGSVSQSFLSNPPPISQADLNLGCSFTSPAGQIAAPTYKIVTCPH